MFELDTPMAFLQPGVDRKGLLVHCRLTALTGDIVGPPLQNVLDQLKKSTDFARRETTVLNVVWRQRLSDAFEH